MRLLFEYLLTILLVLVSIVMQTPATTHDARDTAGEIVPRILRADFENDRPTLRRLHDELAALPNDPKRTPRVRYWQGFALWRKAINAFNESTLDTVEIERDLREAIRDFEDAKAKDARLVDADIGSSSCWGLLAFLNRSDAARARAFAVPAQRMLDESIATAPDNPRLLWVLGQRQWIGPPASSQPEIDARHAKSQATYERGLTLARKQVPSTDPLEPRWGEPELLMSLAWVNLNRTMPDLDAAETYAQSALALAPTWHYVRDILMPQIIEAMRKR
jgi:tetratricopeptide (TPR) repeat protein